MSDDGQQIDTLAMREAAVRAVYGKLLPLIERTEHLTQLIPQANQEAVRRFDASLIDATRRIEQMVTRHTSTTTDAAEEIRSVATEVIKLRAEFIALADRALQDYREEVISGVESKWKRRFTALAVVLALTILGGGLAAGFYAGLQYGKTQEHQTGLPSRNK